MTRRKWFEAPVDQPWIARLVCALPTFIELKYQFIRIWWTIRSKFHPFKPCVVEHSDLGLTEMILEDTLIVWQPWGPYQGHAVDLGYSTDGRLVGIQIWDSVARKPGVPT